MPRGKIPTVAQLERRATDIKARKTKLEARQKLGPKPGTKGDRPRASYKYKGAISGDDYTISASKSGVDFFTEAALGLAVPDGSPPPPRGFRPNLVYASKANATGKLKKSLLTGRDYLSYQDVDSKTTVSNYSAPLVADTPAAVKTKLQAIYATIKPTIGIHGTFRFISEKAPISFG